MQPTKLDPPPVTGSPWRRPVFSRRQLEDLKKDAEAACLKWPMPVKEVKPGESFYELKIFASKGHKLEREAPKRKAMIAEKMAEMPKKMEEHYAARHKARFRTDLQKLLALPKSKSKK